MKPNIGIINSLVRITAGLTLLSWSTAKMVRRSNRNTPFIVAMLGAMKVAEGITRFCPLTYLIQEEVVQIKKQNNQSKMEGNRMDQDNFMTAINPT